MWRGTFLATDFFCGTTPRVPKKKVKFSVGENSETTFSREKHGFATKPWFRVKNMFSRETMVSVKFGFLMTNKSLPKVMTLVNDAELYSTK